MKTAYEYLYIIDQNTSEKSTGNPQLTLTDVFHQFDTITLRGRTSIDRYLNIQRAKQHEIEKEKSITNIQFDNSKRSSIKQNDERLLS